MFGLFKKKKFDFNCPMCSRDYSVKFDPSDITVFDYPFFFNSGLVSRHNCNFCNIEITLVLKKDGDLIACDEKWEKVREEHDNKLNEILEQISELEDQLADFPENKNLVSKLQQLENKQQKLEDSYELKEQKYYDRQTKWEDKWADRLEKI